MKRAVDTSDFLDLQEAKRLVDGAFGGGTAWYPDEQADLHGASSALARVIVELRKETPVMAIARRLASAGGRPARGAAQPATGGTATPARSEPDGPPRRTIDPRVRDITDWDEVEKALGGRERLRRIDPRVRNITDWGRIDKALAEGGSQRAGGRARGRFSPTSAMWFRDDRVRTKGEIPELGLGPKTEGRVLLAINGPPGYGDRQLAVRFEGKSRPMMVSVDEVEIVEGT